MWSFYRLLVLLYVLWGISFAGAQQAGNEATLEIEVLVLGMPSPTDVNIMLLNGIRQIKSLRRRSLCVR